HKRSGVSCLAAWPFRSPVRMHLISSHFGGRLGTSMAVASVPPQGDDAGIQPAPSTEASSPAGAQPGILVVDDDPSIVLLLGVWLKNKGFTVWQANDGAEALKVYQEHKDSIAIVLLDVRMPGMDGPETLAALQTMDGAIQACFMSGDTGEYS